MEKRSFIGRFALLAAANFFTLLAFASDDVRRYSFKIVNIYPHDSTAFTQGLAYEGGYLYESTGLYGRSKIKVIDLADNKPVKSISMEERYFGEGLAVMGDRLVQLTYRERVGFVYDRHTLKVIAQFGYPTEGWGITYDGSHLIMSNGSSHLFYLDPESFRRIRSLKIEEDGAPVSNLNELEYVDGLIFANIWRSNFVAQIEPETGRVVGKIDFGELADRYKGDKSVDVLNGIAYDKAGQRLFVTGKLWPEIFEVELVPVQDEL